MKELNVEEKARRYDEAIKVANKYKDTHIMFPQIKDEIFPELAESEDERIRKELIEFLKEEEAKADITSKRSKTLCKYINWLEKQGQKPQGKSALDAAEEKNVDNQNCVKLANKVKPKFNVGDWIIHQGTENIYQVVAIVDNQYQLKYSDNYTTQYCKDVDRCTRLWDVAKDAKDGDVLASNRSIFIFSQEYIAGKPEAHCGIMNGLFLVKSEGCWTNEKYYPATKEQRDTLMKAMADAGYTFDFEKKELKKI